MDDYMPSRYQLLGRIGEGVHGVVVKARDLQSDDKIVAIKKLSLRTKFGVVCLNTVREIRALQHCRCDNVLELLDMYPDLAGISLVFEYMPHTLYSKLKDEENPLSRATVRRYIAMLLRGLAYLHGVHIMHRDIKPANLLIDRHDVLKIADFGLARIYTDPHLRPPDRSYSPQVATRWYRAPEILWGCQRYGPSIDLWASGAVLAEMLRGVPLFAGATDIEQLALVVRTLGTPNLKDWPEVRSLPDYNKIRFPNSRGERWEDIFPSCTTRDEIGLVDGLVRYNPAKRLTAEEALLHPYFSDAASVGE
ncbi:cyclin-dependent kinase 20 [Anopheles ziemanni]|uniref:cyclin-dependent kinase 20 n=1 Tax=Anopheles coustani TaxID=139045 RepID=UPI0026581F02|nr:cyclin-dependent kinase 20 [Anopheles coustani]XP_058169904.1 cyclin-dependent kinase 20 [Anopheles ziemanni]